MKKQKECPNHIRKLLENAKQEGRLLGLQEANEIIDNQENKCGIDSWDCETVNAIRRKLKSAMKKTKKQELYPPDDEYVGAEKEGDEP